MVSLNLLLTTIPICALLIMMRTTGSEAAKGVLFVTVLRVEIKAQGARKVELKYQLDMQSSIVDSFIFPSVDGMLAPNERKRIGEFDTPRLWSRHYITCFLRIPAGNRVERSFKKSVFGWERDNQTFDTQVMPECKVSYRIEKVCPENYYGYRNCELYCVPDEFIQSCLEPQTGKDAVITCRPGYRDESQNCTTDIDECVEKTDLCKHGGVCENTEGSFKCNCKSPWMGPTCKRHPRPCAALTPCRNGGTCSESEGEYRCSCLPAFSGKNCGTAKETPKPIQQTRAPPEVPEARITEAPRVPEAQVTAAPAPPEAEGVSEKPLSPWGALSPGESPDSRNEPADSHVPKNEVKGVPASPAPNPADATEAVILTILTIMIVSLTAAIAATIIRKRVMTEGDIN